MRREWSHQCGTRQRRTTKSRYSNKGSTKIEVRNNATNARSSRFRTKQRSRLRGEFNERANPPRDEEVGDGTTSVIVVLVSQVLHVAKVSFSSLSRMKRRGLAATV
ncbi:hypothetical protein Tco_0633109 [Tanacetum coccineum]